MSSNGGMDIKAFFVVTLVYVYRPKMVFLKSGGGLLSFFMYFNMLSGKQCYNEKNVLGKWPIWRQLFQKSDQRDILKFRFYFYVETFFIY